MDGILVHAGMRRNLDLSPPFLCCTDKERPSLGELQIRIEVDTKTCCRRYDFMRIKADTTKFADRSLGDSDALDSRLTRMLYG